MSSSTGIEWTDSTWNPVRGCSRVSAGCQNCYAERQAIRHAGPGGAYEGLVTKANGHPVWTGKITLVPELLDQPLHWRKSRRVFVNSMSDLFHDGIPFEFIDRVFAVMASSNHTFQVLTKRPARMRAYMQRVADGAPAAGQRYESELRAHFERYKYNFREGYSLPMPATPELRLIYDSAARQENRPANPDGTTLKAGFSGGEYHWRSWPLSNVWLGVSVEDQATADERLPLLLQTPAAVRFVSYEPAIEQTNLGPYLSRTRMPGLSLLPDLGDSLPGLDWVIVGGESGPGARHCDPRWIRYVVRQCQVAAVPVFVKQLGSDVGESAPDGGPSIIRYPMRDRKGGDPSEWPEDLQVREFPQS
jgi:protein gp37